MLIFLLLCLFAGGFFIELIQRYVLRVKKPDIEDLWIQLEKESWFIELMKDPEVKDWIAADKKSGLLSDHYYVQKVIDREEHREGFLKYLAEKTKPSTKKFN
ncbi:MAG TPA: hypothetical protein VEY51_07350 [Chondromyces sp.]|nr:hypothetical protein [Chondromyces sp.]